MDLLTAIKNIKEARKDLDVFSALRGACSERGYHRICAEPEKDDDIISCYDCDLWFTKRSATDYDGTMLIKYKVEPLE